ncbi:GlsB/YeaQ/YmgE family stress response membrane protein [Cognatilysobacter lacus]|uniref:GlsB/YeaQ/YmgE family stress response membrane protein n=1 Tax=Cognatilysobacter lacus TaxID=1643323 RepID=A0A5D8ZC05_9GAMM|nr:GlsB/YeaQ/YmgE family stress response membrane protein [Lysobacter lacus]TZF91583.1 GlsB/YeaQ/YmgE family stress response membrane protein [Lysobacter lacus]
MFHGFFGYLIGGAIVGVLARIVKPGPENVGLIMTILIGAAGAAIAGTLMPGSGAMSWVVAIATAVILLIVYQGVFKRPRPPRD